ncbi:MAG TPA: ABC transporter permease [Candidatus Limnocylindrales bacterium]|nr:ABC transporter permease [Candidatus Limnocylindrales bacterium]
MSAPAPTAHAISAMTAMELRLTARRGENLLVTIVIPAVVLVFFASVSILPATVGRPVDFLLPGSIALAIIATSLVNLGIATAYERHYGVLKRLGGSPLTRTSLLVSKTAAVVVVEVVQIVVLVAIAVGLLGWRPILGAPLALVPGALILGTAAFAGLGLAMAGGLRAEATLALANGLFLAFLLLGGIVIPLDHLPGPLAALGSLLPAAALTDLLRAALGGSGDVVRATAVLVAWAVGAITVAARTFAWE